MSAYVRQSLGLNRPSVTFGSQQRNHSRSRNGGGGENDSGGRSRRDRGGGRNTRFASRDRPPTHPQRQQRRRTSAAVGDRFSREAIFGKEAHDDVYDDEKDEDVPIEGSIHANENDSRNFSQVTLSQLSDGPSVRSFRSLSQPSGGAKQSSWNSGKRGGHFGGGLQRGEEGPGRGGDVAGSNGNSRGIRQHSQAFSQPRRIGSRGGGREHARSSACRDLQATTRNDDDEDDGSLKSSQSLLSHSRPTPNAAGKPSSSCSRTNSNRPSSSGRQLLTSFSQSTRPPSRGRQHDQDSRLRHREDENSTLPSQSLLSPLRSIPPRCLDGALKRQSITGGGRGTSMSQQEQKRGDGVGKISREPSRLQRMTSTAFRTPSRLMPPPRSSVGRRSSAVVSTAVRTVGAISGTIASLPYTPSRALRSVASLAARTTATFAGLTPLGKGRVRSGLLASSSGAAANGALGSTLVATATSSSLMRRPALAAGDEMERSTTQENDRERSSGAAVDGQARTQAINRAQPVAANNQALQGVVPDTEMRGFVHTVNDRSCMEGGQACNFSTDSSGELLKQKGSQMKPPPPRQSNAVMSQEEENRSHSDPLPPTSMVAEKAGEDARNGPRGDDAVMEPSTLHCNNGTKSNNKNSDDESPQEIQATFFTISESETKKRHPDGKDHDDDDDVESKTSASTLDMHGKEEGTAFATSKRNRDDLREQQDCLEKSRREFQEMNDHAKREWEKEYAKLETLQRSTEAEFATLRESMDVFSAKAASSSHDRDLAMRTLVSQLTTKLQQESSQSVELISNQAREMKEQLPSEIRALVETEARKCAMDMLGEMFAEAKSDFQDWVDGVVKSAVLEKKVPQDVAIVETARVSVRSHIDGGDSNSQKEDKTRRDTSMSHQSSEHETTGASGNTASASGRASRTTTGDSVPILIMGNVTDSLSSIGAPDNSTIGDSSWEKENREPDTTVGDPTIQKRKPDTMISNQSGSGLADPDEERKQLSSSSVSSSLSIKSAPTTPFSRKATPLQNNHAKNKNRFSIKTSYCSKHGSKMQAKSAVSINTKTNANIPKNTPTIELNRNVRAPQKSDSAKTKSRKVYGSSKSILVNHGEPSCEKPPRTEESMDAPKDDQEKDRTAFVDKTPKPKRGTQTQQRVDTGGDGPSKNSQRNMRQTTMLNFEKLPRTKGINETSRKDRNAFVDTAPQPKRTTQAQRRVGTDGNDPPKKAQKKRRQSAMLNATKSPRRSKRLKEVTRVEQMAAVQIATAALADIKVARTKSRKVTPKEDNTSPQITSTRGDASDNVGHTSVICHSTSGTTAGKTGAPQKTSSVSAGYDSLLGTSVSVPAHGSREDELIGFDDDEIAQPDRRSLSSLLPFGGLRGRKDKSMAKKRSKKKKKYTFDFGFY